MKTELRTYQKKAIDHVAKSKKKRILFTGPTGCGKTVIASALINKALKEKKRVLVVVHRKELAVQMYEQIIAFGVKKIDVGVLMGTDAQTADGKKRVNDNAKIQVAGIDTLTARDLRPKADLVIVDECHRVMADSYQTLLSAYSKAIHIGFTATPIRFDGRGLGDFYEELYIIAKPSQLVKEGWLVAPKIFTVPKHLLPDLKGVRSSGGDYSISQMESRVNKKKLIGNVYNEYVKHATNKQTVIFAVSVKHAEALTKRFLVKKVPTALLTGKTPVAERETTLNAFESKRIKVIVNVGVLTEGWDMPICKCIILARPTRSLGLYLQMSGRIERPYKNQIPVILDHAGCVEGRKFGFPTDDQPWSLLDPEENGTGSAPTKTCGNPKCNLIIPAGCVICPECGFENVIKVDILPETKDNLVELKAFRERVEKFAKERGLKQDWVEKVVNERQA